MIEGFQSFGKRVVFQLDRVGLNLIKGTNGVGKSTIFNAILWCEYGGNLKKSVETWKEKRPKDYKGTRVVVERTDGEYDYRIVRHLKYKGTTFGLTGGDKLMIFKKPVDEPKFGAEHLVGDGLHKADMQLIINDQIGMDEKTFLNSIMFGQRVKSLVEAPNADKRKLFEELFALDFIDEAKEKAKEKYDEVETERAELERNLESAEEKILSAKDTKAEQLKILEEFEDNKKERVAEAEKEVKATRKEIDAIPAKRKALEKEIKKYDLEAVAKKEAELTNLENDYKIVRNDYDGAEGRIKKLDRSISDAEDNILKLNQDLANVETVCPYCSGPIKKDKVAETKKAIKDKISAEQSVIKTHKADKEKQEKELAALLDKKSDLDVKVSKLREELSELKKNSQKAYELQSELKQLGRDEERLLKELEKQEAKLKKESEAEPPKVDLEKYDKIIETNQKILEEGADKLKELTEKSEKIDWWIKKGFGSGGLKSFVFNAMLNQLNIYAQKYANRLGFRVEFSVDMTKASKPFQTLIYDGEFVRDYEDLSGGQKQRVDVCVAFAMHDLISHKADINILVMDEIFEGLDNAGVESAFDLIRQKAEEHSVYLVTHSDIIDSLNCRSVVLDLDEDGNTEIVA